MASILNLDEIEYQTQRHGEVFEAAFGPVASRIGARRLGYRVTVIDPDVGEYPDSGKFSVFAGAAPGGDKSTRRFLHVGLTSDPVDYWLGEDGGT